MRPAAVVLLIVGVLQFVFAVLAIFGQTIRPSSSTAAYVLAIFVGCCALASMTAAIRGAVRTGERIGLMTAQGLQASCVGLGLALGTSSPTTFGGMTPAFRVFVFAFVVLAGLLPLVAIPALAYLPPRFKPSRLGEFGDGVIDQPEPAPGAGAKAALYGSVVIGVLFVGIMTALFFSNQGATPTNSTLGATETKRFEEMNFEIQSPDSSWVFLEPESLSPDASVLLRKRSPEIIMLIIAENGADMVDFTSEALAEIAIANMKGASQSATVLSREPQEFAGINGVIIRSEASVSNLQLRYTHLVGVDNGFLYQLITYGEESNAELIDDSALELAAHFRLLDPTKRASTDLELLEEPLRSELFGVELDLTGQNWLPWSAISDKRPDFELAALRNDGAAIAVIPILFDIEPPPLEITTDALLQILGFETVGPDVSSVSPIERQGLPGTRVDAVRRPDDDGDVYAYRMEVVQGERFACLLACWWTDGIETARNVAWRALDSVTIEPPEGDSQERYDAFDQNQRERHARFFNNVGLEFDELDRNADELVWFREAFRFAPDDVMIFENAASTFDELGRVDDAARFVREHAERFTGVEAITRLDALYHARAGDAARARAKYQELFTSGYRNDQDLRSYVTLLIEESEPDAALRAAESYAGAARGADAAIARADALDALERYPEATGALRTAAEGPPFDAAPLRHLVDLAYNRDHYSDAIDASKQIIDRRADTANTWYMRGLSESALGWHRQAKSSLEQALERAPSSDVVRDELRYVSALLGQGENASIRQPIDPVEIPANLLSAEPGADWLDGARDSHGMVYDYVVRAYEFSPDERYRQTDLYRARVLDQRGRDALGSFEFSFDPVSERLFVNHLRVFDADGELIHEGRPDEWYVLDDEDASSEASFDQTLHIPVAALEPGRTIELMVSRERLSPPTRLPYIERAFVMTAPAARLAFMLRAAPDDVEIVVDDQAERWDRDDHTTWFVDRPEPFKVEERQPPFESWIPMFRAVGRGNTWNGLAVEYLDDIDERLEESSSVESLAQRLTKGLESIDQRAAALASFVQQSLSYRAIEFGRRAWLPNDADAIIHNRYGDCKDHALLLHQLLRAADIESHLALVHTSAPITPQLPSTDQFNHMIVHVPDLTRGRYIDPTDKNTPPLLGAPYYLAAQMVLILDREEPRLEQIPGYEPGDYRRTCRRTVVIGADARVTIDERVILSGIGAEAYRNVLTSLARRDDAQTIAGWFSSDRIAVENLRVEIHNVDDPARDLIIELRYALARPFDVQDGAIRGTIPTLWAAHTLDEISSGALRRSPFEIHFPLHLAVTTLVKPPEGFRLAPLEAHDRSTGVQTPFWRCVASSTPEVGAVRLDIECSIPTGRHPAGDWSQFEDTLRSATEAFAQPVELLPNN